MDVEDLRLTIGSERLAEYQRAREEERDGFGTPLPPRQRREPRPNRLSLLTARSGVQWVWY